jgi:hypothetical protein
MVAPILAHSPNSRDWFRAVRRLFAKRTQRWFVQFDPLVPPLTAARASTSITDASSPEWRCCTEVDSSPASVAAGIASEDWDLLFRAALDLLARMAVEKAAADGPDVRLQAPGTALRECIDALEQLRRSAPPAPSP